MESSHQYNTHMQGLFHVGPNAQEDVVFNFNFFSDNLSLNVFGGVLGFEVTTCI